MEDILAIIFIFGGTAAVALSFSPIGRALADRLRGREVLPGHAADAELMDLREEVATLRAELEELHERVDFGERLLAGRKDAMPAPPES